jgi:Family of unknown function (DUF5675)
MTAPAVNGTPAVLLTRLVPRSDGMFSWLSVASFGSFFLERPWRRNASDDPATPANESSCIPSGHYRLALLYSEHFKRMLWHVLDVPNRAGIEIHPANRASQLKGCGAPGQAIGHDGPTWTVEDSGDALEAFHAAMGSATVGTLTIVDAPGPMTDLHHMAPGPE